MEDEKTGELFLSCTACTKKCYIFHGKHHEKEGFDGFAAFFKIMVGEFAEKLRIPPAFVSQFLNETDDHIVLQGQSGKEWKVELNFSNERMEFRGGRWKEFVNYHNLQSGDFVLFRYIRKSCLEVHMFGRSGCLKNISTLPSEKPNIDSNTKSSSKKVPGSNQPAENELLINLASDEEEPVAENERKRKSALFEMIYDDEDTSLDEEPVVENERKRKPAGAEYERTKKTSFLGMVSNEEDAVEGEAVPGKSSLLGNPAHCFPAEKHKTMESAAPFESDKPFCRMVMKSWNVNGPYQLRTRKSWGNLIQLPKQRSEVVLLVGNSEEWKVRCVIGRNNTPFLSGGWRYFVRDNNLKEGDTCIFEQLSDKPNKFIFRVHIFPYVRQR